MPHIQVNVIPFTPVNSKLTFAFHSDNPGGGAPIHWSKLFDEFPEGRSPAEQFYYSGFEPHAEGAISVEIDVYQATTFANHYFCHLIYRYFKSNPSAVVFPNYVKDVEVWFHDSPGPNEPFNIYHKFSISPQWGGIIPKSFQLVVSYNGTSKVLKTSVKDMGDFDSRRYKKVLCDGAVYHYEKTLPSELRQLPEKIFPVLNLELKESFDIQESFKKENRYPTYHQKLQWFYNTYLNCPAFNELIQLDSKGFFTVPTEWVHYVGKGNNNLQFRNGTHINPGLGIVKHKPLQAFTKGHLKLFFIYNKRDAEFVKGHMYKFMMEGWHGVIKGKEKHANPLISYINQPFSFDASKQTAFNDNNNIYEEVKQQIDKHIKEPDCTYVAIYISPIAKDDVNHPQHEAYYKIKLHLLDKGITSQVIYKEHLDKPDFYYYLPNIYVALLAKMGGIPWLLARTRAQELVIGVGAFKPKAADQRFVGSAFCFDNSGKFEGFQCFKSTETKYLAGSIKNAVETYITQHQQVSRIVIHFYKEISNPKELKPILAMLDSIGHGQVPVIVVTINKTESRELLAFDLNSPGKMPLSGTFLQVGYNKYLLFNNVRYNDEVYLQPKDYHFPIKLSFKSTQPELLTQQVIGELIDQVYQFSRMYWKSVSQQNMPVTTIYPEMVAKIFPHFDRDKLPEFGEKSLWFL